LDFFARQEQSRRTSRMLIGAFVLAFTLVALATTLVVAIALRLQLDNNALYTTSQTWWQWVDAHLALVGGVAAAIPSSWGSRACIARRPCRAAAARSHACSVPHPSQAKAVTCCNGAS
jgi:hypothetical protein